MLKSNPQVPQPQQVTRSTSGTHRDCTGVPPARHRRRGQSVAEAEVGGEAGQSHPKATPRPPQGHILGIDSGVQSHLKATPRLPQGYPKATPRLPQGYPKATPRLHQGYTKATPRPPSSHLPAGCKPDARQALSYSLRVQIG